MRGWEVGNILTPCELDGIGRGLNRVRLDAGRDVGRGVESLVGRFVYAVGALAKVP